MKSPNPLISVIIPVFNRAWQLRRALESLRIQSFKDFEVIVCDDGSTEDIAMVVKVFEGALDIHYLYMPNWGGPAKPRNEGLKIARGEWISYLDSDDWWDENRLGVVASNLHESVDILYHLLRVVRESSQTKSREKRPFVGGAINVDPFTQMMLMGNPLPTSATVIRKDMLLEQQGMSEERELIALEDFDCWLRLASTGAHFYFLDQCLGNYWVGSDAISAISQRHIEAQKLLYLRHEPILDEASRIKALARQNYVLGSMYYRLGKSRDALQHLKPATPLPNLKLSVKRWVLMIYSVLDIIRKMIH